MMTCMGNMRFRSVFSCGESCLVEWHGLLFRSKIVWSNRPSTVCRREPCKRTCTTAAFVSVVRCTCCRVAYSPVNMTECRSSLSTVTVAGFHREPAAGATFYFYPCCTKSKTVKDPTGLQVRFKKQKNPSSWVLINMSVGEGESAAASVCSSSKRWWIWAVWGFHGGWTKPSGVRNVLRERSLFHYHGTNSVGGKGRGGRVRAVFVCAPAFWKPLPPTPLVLRNRWMKENPRSEDMFSSPYFLKGLVQD